MCFPVTFEKFKNTCFEELLQTVAFKIRATNFFSANSIKTVHHHHNDNCHVYSGNAAKKNLIAISIWSSLSGS